MQGENQLSHLALILAQTRAQHADLDAFLQETQNPLSPAYRSWLTPEQFADRFQPSASEVRRVADWLGASGFKVKSVARSRGFIVFSGSVAQVEETFQTEIRQYAYGAKNYYAPSKPPSIPAEFGQLIAGIRGLDSIYPRPLQRPGPMYTAANGTHALAPGDIAAIYGLQEGNGGHGQRIAVVGDSDINLADIRLFRSTFQLPANDPQLMLVGEDPGVDSSGGLLEADSDIEWAGGVAPNATIIYVYAADVFAAAQAAIDQNIATILTFSFLTCEADVSPSDAASIRALAQQANAEGITWVAASGDAGAATCDQGSALATQGLAVAFPASLPEVTAVGGTEFDEPYGSWGSNSTSGQSAGGYFPEVAWNDTAPSIGLSASGGGVSILYPQPSWQIGLGVPNNGARNMPDLALDASPNHDPYLMMSGQEVYGVGGTSLATPVFAGIVALMAESFEASTASATGLGNINPSLYALAESSFVKMFNDITSGNNFVPCAVASPDCTNGQLGYSAGPGYDLVTGLGSVNGQLLVNAFGFATVTGATVSASQVTEGDTVAVTAMVRGFSGRIPSGAVYFYDGTSLLFMVGLDSSGSATYQAALQPGSHSIAARFQSNGEWLTSSSAGSTVIVLPHAPQTPALANPTDKAAGVSLSIGLNWSEAESTASFDLYFGTTSPPPYWGQVSALSCYPSGLAGNTTYYWKIVAKNISGLASSPTWSFTTSSSQGTYTVSKIAGNGSFVFSGDGGPATQASVSAIGVAVDSANNIYLADTGNNRIRKITTSGIISTIGGSGVATNSGDGGPAVQAGISGPSAIAVDPSGNIYFDSGLTGDVIREISAGGTISTVAGNGKVGFTGDGPALSAEFWDISGLAPDSAGNIYMADLGNNCVQKLAGGMVSTIAGRCAAAAPPQQNGAIATAVSLNAPAGLAIDPANHIYIAENSDIVQVSNGLLTDFAGFGVGVDGPALNARMQPRSIAVDAQSNVYVHGVIGSAFKVARIANGILTTIAGNSTTCCEPGDGMAGTSALMDTVRAITVDQNGRVLLAANSYVWALTPASGPPAVSIDSGGVRNAASFATGPVAPGSIVTLFGTFALNQPDQASAAPLPSILSGLTVQIQKGATLTAPLYYASAGQVNLQIPWEVSGQSSVFIGVSLNGIAGPTQSVQIAPYAPGIFTVGSPQGAVLDATGNLVTSSNPASAGSVIQIYCTGLGMVTNPPATGAAASSSSLSYTVTQPTVTIDGVDALVLFSGLAPGTVGEYQVNVQVPPGVTAGSAVPLLLSVGGVGSNTVTLGVR